MGDLEENNLGSEAQPNEEPMSLEMEGNNIETKAQRVEQTMPSSEEQEAAVKKKYGGVIPKKPPLISKDHERAYFDSADWALGKEGKTPGQKPKTVECLRPKLQPTPHQPLPSRRASYAIADGEDADGVVASSEEAT